MRVMILDDEQLILNHLRLILNEFPEVEIIFETTNPLEALECFKEKRPDVVFADISMPEMNGMELAERFFELDASVKIVFITAYEQFALEAFRVNAIDYILKPVTTSKIRKTMCKLLKTDTVYEKKAPETVHIIGTQNNRFYVIHQQEGKYIKSVTRDLILVTDKGEYYLKYTLAYWEEKLKNFGWFRCHKGYLINIDQIEEVYPMFNYTYNVRMKGVKEEILVSRTYAKQFKNLLNL